MVGIVILICLFIIILISETLAMIQQSKYNKNRKERIYSEKEIEMMRRQMPIWDDFDEDEYKYTDTY